MAFPVFCLLVLIFYVLIWFFDSFFKSCMHYPYYAFLQGTGLKVGILNFSWTTTAFNRLIYRWGKTSTRFLSTWFTCGYLVTVYLFLPFAIWTLMSFIYEHFHDSIQLSSIPEMKIMLPGLNIPLSDMCVYVIAITVSSIFHEFGHALAATLEDVSLVSVGVYVWMIIPLAFTELNTEQLNSISIKKRLKIYCAGAWHNVVCALFALLLYFSVPYLFTLGYVSDIGVRVTGFAPDSPLKDLRGLETKDVITSINGCDIKNRNDYKFCLHMAHERFGICTSSEFIAQHDEIMMESFKENDVVECCRSEDVLNFCFEYMEPKTAGDSALSGQYSCLKPRLMIKDKFEKCTEVHGYMCPNNMHCLKPSLHNVSYFMVIERRDKTPVLYLGLPYDLMYVSVDQYFPRYTLFSAFSPIVVEDLFRYIFMLSMGLGFVNVIPCYGLDGQYIVQNLIQVLAKYLNKNGDFVTFFTVFTVVVGTGITVPTLVCLFYEAVFNV